VKIFLLALSVCVVLLVGGGIIVGPQISAGFQSFSSEKKGTPVKLHVVERTSLTESVSAPGAVEPRRDVDISARFTARIKRIPFEEGDRVGEGDVVVELDAEDLIAALERERARLKSEEARLQGLRASLTVAQSEWRRQKDLYETKDVALSSLEQAERSYYTIKADLEAAEYGLLITQATIQQREEELKYAQLRSPIEGTIVNINAEVGETVVAGTMNNMGTVILNIADFDEMLVKARVGESDIAPVADGQAAKVYINAYPDEVFDGRVHHIGLNRLSDNAGAGYFEVEIVLDSKGMRLRKGLSANVDIQVAEYQDVLTVPSQCVQERLVDELDDDVIEGSELVDRSKRYANLVYRFVDGEAVATPVKVGASDLIDTIIEEGLAENDVVVAGPFKTLMSLKHKQQTYDEREDDEDNEFESEVVEENSPASGQQGDAMKDASTDDATEQATDASNDDAASADGDSDTDADDGAASGSACAPAVPNADHRSTRRTA
jgi:HlyD family secretion protein